MGIQNPLRCIILWLLLIVAMILHFNYHVGGIFYGKDLARPDATGIVPFGTHLIRNVFYHLPMIWILLLVFFNHKFIRIGLFLISILYSISHLLHLIGEMKNPDFSQMPLLSLTLFISIILSIQHYKYSRVSSINKTPVPSLS